MNLFATVLTHTAPSANYRGESAENRAVIQKITKGRFEYAIISPEAIRNALRETLRTLGLPSNRTRLDDEVQLAVEFLDFPDADAYADDFFMGWLIAAKSDEKQDSTLKKNPAELAAKAREKIEAGNASKLTRQEILACVTTAKGRTGGQFSFKRDSILRMNMAVALEPYRHDSVFTQSPLNAGRSPWKNADSSQLLHRETAFTAYQFPFALNLEHCRAKPDWTRTLLKAIGQLNDVAGNHARSYFEMAPASIVVRLTPSLVAGYDTYGFQIADGGHHVLPEVVRGLTTGAGAAGVDYPGSEFYLGGKIVRDMDNATTADLKGRGVTLDSSPQRLLDTVAEAAFPTPKAG